MLQTMSYRVGFQRLYAVLTVAWVGFILLTTPANRLQVWSADLPKNLIVDPSQASTLWKPVSEDPGEWLGNTQ